MTKTVVRVEKEMQKKITRFDLVLSASDHIFQRMPVIFPATKCAFRVNINCDKWYQTMDEKARLMLQDPPSLADGMDRETEKNLRFFGCSLIQEGAVLLKLPQVAAATGQILFQRFYYLKSFLKFRYEHTVMACLLLASKIEEEPRRTRDVYNTFYRLEQLHKLRESGRTINE
ncbi:unnamed protein product [Heligmosomoides polygyrus]|uniref:CYCLIN domain-containing protein n=1 Tax=Heligmosomoides polygyrus TaxID=6339 RepID=A0A183G9H6_HELPZ|nr:unnamed protein product [Heligmosomoides polygyrus]